MTKDEMIEFYKSFIPRLTSEILNLQKSLEDSKRTAEYWERAYGLSKPIEYEHYMTVAAGGVVYDYKTLLPKKEHQDQLQKYKDSLEQL